MKFSYSLLSKLMNLTTRSKIAFRHSAVLLRGNRPIRFSINTFCRTSLHAEMNLLKGKGHEKGL